MFRYGNERRQQKLFNLEKHAISDIAQVSSQECFALDFLKDVLLREFLHYDQNSDFRLFFHILSFLMLAF